MASFVSSVLSNILPEAQMLSAENENQHFVTQDVVVGPFGAHRRTQVISSTARNNQRQEEFVVSTNEQETTPKDTQQYVFNHWHRFV